MKKITIFSFLVTALFLFSSCEGLIETILGSASIVLTDANGGTYYSPDEPGESTVNFSSCVMDITNPTDTTIATLALGANIDLTQAEVITYPYVGILLTDSVATTYSLDSISINILYNLDVASLLKTFSERNMVALAVNDTTWYVSNSGSLTVSSFASVGHLTEGTIENGEMLYITQSKIDYLSDLIDRAAAMDMEAITELSTLQINTYFPVVSMSGTFSSRRMNITSLVNSL